ncbi:hypothetical protein SPHINGO361_140101 [Sphingomonas sp. EC-HK361]|nr:hypothetical protein SPHINGO361_140101 [Sphingomonas sp. EC-HK361]
MALPVREAPLSSIGFGKFNRLSDLAICQSYHGSFLRWGRL